MRVAFDARSLAGPALRGWDRYTVGLVTALRMHGVEAVLLTRARLPINRAHLSGIEAEVIEIADRGGLWWEQVAAPAAARRAGCDVYHAPAERGIPLRSRLPTVLTIHSVTEASYADLIRSGQLAGTLSDYLPRSAARLAARAYWRLQVRAADHVVVPSRFTRDEAVAFLGLSPDRVTVTPLAAADEFHASASPAGARQATLERLGVRQPFLLFVGGFEPHKNPRGVIRVFARVAASHPQLHLVLVGTGDIPAGLRGAVPEAGLASDRVIFLRDLGAELRDLYDEAACFLSLSWRESFGLPALEALARGAPVVASAWGAAREVLGDAAALVDPRDEDAAAQAVLRALDQRDGSSRERRRARARRFRWDVTALRTAEVYNALTGQA